jgi:BioD-like phosphotransacetylase family protein
VEIHIFGGFRKMSVLFIGSTGDHAGQSLMAWAIARRLLEEGFRVGFLKPFGTRPVHINDRWTDADAFLFKEALNMPEPLEVICPYMPAEIAGTQQGAMKILEHITSIARKLSAGKDILLILGTKHIFFDDVPHALPDISIIKELNADLVLVHRYKKISTSLYSILSILSLLKGKVKGVIINRTPAESVDNVRDQISVAFEKNRSTNIIVLPEDPTLSLWNMRGIQEVLHGQIIWGEEYLDRPVEGITVGTSDLHGELTLFKRVYNKIILLAPSRVSGTMEDPGTSRSIAGILLTGNREPAQRVIEASKKSKIPLILIKKDSFSAKECLDLSTPTLKPSDHDKVLHFMKMMDRDYSLNRLIHALGFSR